MTPDTFIDIVLRGEDSELHNIGEYYRSLPTERRDEICSALFARASVAEDAEFLRIVGFSGATLALHGISPEMAEKLVSLVVDKSRGAVRSAQFKYVVGVCFAYIHPNDKIVQIGLPFLKELSKDKNDEVKLRALTGLGQLLQARDIEGTPDEYNADIFAQLSSVWHDDNCSERVRAKALASLYNARFAGESFDQPLAELVVEAFNSQSSAFRHSAMWLMGGLSVQGFLVPAAIRREILSGMLRVLRQEGDIPESWFLAAFKATPGRLPKWAEQKLQGLKGKDLRELEFLFDKSKNEKIQSNRQEFRYDVTISFAGEDRTYAADLAGRLIAKGVKVFYDDYEQADLWGKDLYQHLQTIYRDTARFCVIIVSSAYLKKLWARHELKQAQARAFTENSEYILPLKIDDVEIPGINPTVGYISLKDRTMASIADLLVKKIKTSER